MNEPVGAAADGPVRWPGAPVPDATGGPPASAGAPDPTGDADWQHLHPLSPVLRGGVIVLAFGGYVVSQVVDDVLRGIGGTGPRERGDQGDQGDQGVQAALDHPLIALGLLVAVILGAVGLGWLSWRFSRFRITPGQVELRTGWLFRQHRQVPLERIQAVEISRPLLAQMAGLSRVVVQSAGGGDSQLTLAYLGRERADEVRDHILRMAARTDERSAATAPAQAGPSQPPPSQPGHGAWVSPEASGVGPVAGPLGTGGQAPAGPDGIPVIAVPNGRLFVATILHGSTIALGALAILVASSAAGATLLQQPWAIGMLEGLPALLPLALGVAVARVKELLKHGNFTITDLGPSIRLRHGLTDQRATTIPLHRVQALEMVQPLWWRPLRWWRARINVAGIKGSDDDPFSQTALLPVGSLEEVLRVLLLVDPRLSIDDLTRAAKADGTEGGWTLVPPRARPLDPWAWQRKGVAVTDHCVLVRDGRWNRSVTIAPHARVQSMTLSQGPIERRLAVSTVQLVSTPGPVAVRIEHLDETTAETFLREESARAAAARSHADAGSATTGSATTGSATSG